MFDRCARCRLCLIVAVLVVALAGCDASGPSPADETDDRDGPISVGSVADLRRVGDDAEYPLTADYVLTRDLDLSASADWNDGAGFDPIGAPGAPFRGTFDGNGHTLSGLTIRRPETDSVGLFATTRGATVDHLTLRAVDVRGGDRVGAVVGMAASTTLSRVDGAGRVTADAEAGGLVGLQEEGRVETASADVAVEVTNGFGGGLVGESDGGALRGSVASGRVTGVTFLGGLVGTTEDGPDGRASVRQCLTRGDVTGTTRVGGLVGWSKDTDLRRSHAAGAVEGSDRNVGGLLGTAARGTVVLESSAEGAVSGSVNAGGLVGNVAGAPGDSVLIAEAAARGPVTGTDNVGGLVGGATDARIAASFAEGDVAGEARVGGVGGVLTDARVIQSFSTSAVTGDENVGGVAGTLDLGSVVRSSYAAGRVSSTGAVGGLVGQARISRVETSYWDRAVTTQNVGVGRVDDASLDAQGLATREMQGALAADNMRGFDFTDTWRTEPGGYPTLRWVPPSATTGWGNASGRARL
jgi:hypothetical protein